MKTIFTALVFCCTTFYSTAQLSQYSMLDYSFGKSGKVVTNIDAEELRAVTRTKSVLLQKDGKIITVGEVQRGLTANIFLARFLRDGTVDLSFGSKGYIHYGHSGYDELFQAQLQSDGKIVAVILSGGKKYLIRFTSSGLDSSFGENGLVQLAHAGNSIDIDKDDRIIVGETTMDQGNSVCAVQRFYKNGNPDSSYGINNLSSISIGKGNTLETRIKLDKNGKIIVGCTLVKTIKADFIIIRFNSNGTIDSSFSDSGWIDLKYLNTGGLTAMAIQDDNKIIAGGYTNQEKDLNENFILTRIQTNGIVDSSFGIKGSVITDFNYNPNAYPKKQDYLSALIIQNDNKIIAAGYTYKYLFGNDEFALCRYNVNGELDTSFGLRGQVRTKFTDNIDSRANDAILQPDGKILLAGYYEPENGAGNGGEIAMARYVEEKFTSEKQNVFSSITESKKNLITVYPNPTKNILHIEGLNATVQCDVKIINENGSIVLSTQINKNTSCNLNIQNLSSGVYYVSFISNQNTITKKFIKER